MSAPWRNRIVGYGEEAPDQLLANPGNWRTHPLSQTDALGGVLRDVGLVQNVIVNKTSGFVVDGHARIALALRDGQPTIPVTYVELDPSEEALILATLDPLSAMAGTDAAQLDALLREVSTGDAALQAMLAELAEQAGIIATLDPADAFGMLPDGDRAPFQAMTFTLCDAQAAQVQDALNAAKSVGPFGDTGNANSNGNALARIVEAYLGSS